MSVSMEYDKQGLAITDRWIAHTEDVDNGKVDIFGEFSSHKAALDYVKDLLVAEISTDGDDYDDWVYGKHQDVYMDWFDNNTNDDVYRKEYLEEMREEHEETREEPSLVMQGWLPNEPSGKYPKTLQFEWRIYMYVLTPTKLIA